MCGKDGGGGIGDGKNDKKRNGNEFTYGNDMPKQRLYFCGPGNESELVCYGTLIKWYELAVQPAFISNRMIKKNFNLEIHKS